MPAEVLNIRILRSAECLKVRDEEGTIYLLKPDKRIYYLVAEEVAQEQIKTGNSWVDAPKVLEIITTLNSKRGHLRGRALYEYGTIGNLRVFHTDWTQKFRGYKHSRAWTVTDEAEKTILSEKGRRVLKSVFKSLHSEGRAVYSLGRPPSVQILFDDTGGSAVAPSQQTTLPPHLDEQVLRNACKAQTRAALSHAGLLDLTEYVARESVWGHLQSFMRSERTLFILVGDSGCGKSWLMSSFAQSLDCPVLFVPGTLYRSEEIDPIEEALRLLDEFLAAQGAETDELRSALAKRRYHLLADMAQAGNSHLVVVLDALDNLRNPQRALELLCRTASAANISNHCVKFIVSCRNAVWGCLSSRVTVPEHCLFLSKGSDVERYLPALAAPSSFSLSGFNESELKAAIETYRKKYHFKGRVFGNVLELCVSPLILRLVAQAYAGQTIPDDLALGKVFDAYLAHFLHSSPAGTDRFLVALVSKMRKERVPELKDRDITASVAYYQEDRLRHLESTGLLQGTKGSTIRFWHDRILEFCLSLTLPSDDEEFFSRLDSIIQEADRFWNIEKAIILYASTKDGVFQRRLFAALVQREDWGNSIACGLLHIMTIDLAPLFHLIQGLVNKVPVSVAGCLGIIADRLGIDKFEVICRGIAVNPVGRVRAGSSDYAAKILATSRWLRAHIFMASNLGILLSRRPEYRRLARRWLESNDTSLQEVAYEALLRFSGKADRGVILKCTPSFSKRLSHKTQYVLARNVHWIAWLEWRLGCNLIWSLSINRNPLVRDALHMPITQMVQEQTGPTLNLLQRMTTSSSQARRTVAAKAVRWAVAMVEDERHARLARKLAVQLGFFADNLTIS